MSVMFMAITKMVNLKFAVNTVKADNRKAFILQWYQNHSNFHCYQQIQSVLITLYYFLDRIPRYCYMYLNFGNNSTNIK
jgi:hypothetical protein